MKLNIWIRGLFLALIGTFFILSFNVPVRATDESAVEHYEQARIIKDLGSKAIENTSGCTGAEQLLEIEFTTGPFKGKNMMVSNGLSGMKGLDINVTKGDKVVVCYIEDMKNPDRIQQAYVADVVRTGYLKILAAAFILLMIIIGAGQGIKALLALGLTILCLYKIMLPAFDERLFSFADNGNSTFCGYPFDDGNDCWIYAQSSCCNSGYHRRCYRSRRSSILGWGFSELIATEIVRALAGSIGIIISVPLTAIIGDILNRDSQKQLND